MTINLYNNTSDKRVVNKAINLLATFENAKAVDDFSVTSPEFIIEYNGGLLSQCNYVYCSETNRYYYVDDIIIMTGGRMKISCSGVDVLMSYKSDIYGLTALCVRNETLNNQRIADNDYPVTGDTDIRAVRFDTSAFTMPSADIECYTLIVSGSKGA